MNADTHAEQDGNRTAETFSIVDENQKVIRAGFTDKDYAEKQAREIVRCGTVRQAKAIPSDEAFKEVRQ